MEFSRFQNLALWSSLFLLVFVSQFHPARPKGRREREADATTGRHIKLTTTMDSNISCDRISTTSYYKLQSISLSSASLKKAAKHLYYDVAMSNRYLSSILGSSAVNESYREEAEKTGLCIRSFNLKPSSLTFLPGRKDISTVYFLNNLNITLGNGNRSILFHSWNGTQSEAVFSRAVLNVGNGSLILQRLCFLGDLVKTSLSLLSTRDFFPMDNAAFMACLKKELEAEHNVTFTGVEFCEDYEDRRSPCVVAIALTCFVLGVIIMILYIQVKIFKVIKLPWINI